MDFPTTLAPHCVWCSAGEQSVPSGRGLLREDHLAMTGERAFVEAVSRLKKFLITNMYREATADSDTILTKESNNDSFSF
jgi:hypothetical protein